MLNLIGTVLGRGNGNDLQINNQATVLNLYIFFFSQCNRNYVLIYVTGKIHSKNAWNSI